MKFDYSRRLLIDRDGSGRKLNKEPENLISTTYMLNNWN